MSFQSVIILSMAFSSPYSLLAAAPMSSSLHTATTAVDKIIQKCHNSLLQILGQSILQHLVKGSAGVWFKVEPNNITHLMKGKINMPYMYACTHVQLQRTSNSLWILYNRIIVCGRYIDRNCLFKNWQIKI